MSEPIIDLAAIERLQRIGGTALAEQMIAVFLANAPGRVDSIVQGGSAGDLDAVRRGAHSLKSTSANVGAVQLQRAAAELEALIAAGGERTGAEGERVGQLAAEVESVFATVRMELERIREELTR